MGSIWRHLRAWLFPVWCVGCGAPETGLCEACSDALWAPRELIAGGLPIRAAAPYGGILTAAILAMKRGERAPLDPLAALVAQLVPASAVLVPAVTLRRRAAARGFDQARELAERAARLAGAGYADLLRKHGAAQRGRGRAARLAAAGRFSVRPGRALPGRVLLVDDVVTTGATLRDAAAALTAAGCRVLGAVVVAATAGETSRRAPGVRQ